METPRFKNRISTHPNRKKLTIIDQNINELIVDVEYADQPTEEGSPLNAEVFNEFYESLTNSVNNSNTALNTAQIAITNANEAFNKVVNMMGTTVYVGGSHVSEFNADTKADVIAVNNISSAVTSLSNRQTNLEQKNIISQVTYDEVTDTFNF